jgi:chromosome segregation ATPase
MLDREKLNAAIRELTLKVETSEQKAMAAQESMAQLGLADGELSECKQRLAWMTQQLDRVNNEIALRVGELQTLRENYRSLGSSKANYQGIEQRLVANLAQMEQLVLDLDSSRRENDRLHNDNMNLEASLRGLQGQLIGLADEREDSNRLLNSQAVELQELRQKAEFLAGEGRARQQLEQQMQEQQVDKC